ncbi:tetratricopeptide repeat protein 8, tpr8,putative, partial [Schistosoma mansoni]|uniref:tetratricopeptide repeat protein 8, tpr8,putative n=1 Tax=Schistosoma mansoni TaxID=6183 RepID=UPI00022C8737
LGLKREAECSVSQSLELNPSIEAYTLLAFIAIQLDQPGRALGIYDKGLERFPQDIDLLTGKARIYQKLNNASQSVALYKEISQIDDMNVESLASLAMHYFYEDEPEVSLKRILQYGYESSELYNNLGLCTFYTQQYDLSLSFFNQAIALSDTTNLADIYYNLGHIAIVSHIIIFTTHQVNF